MAVDSLLGLTLDASFLIP